MKTKDYISFNSQHIKISEKNIKSIQSIELLFELMLSIASQEHFSYKKEKNLLQCFITSHYENKELHQKKFFDILMIHCVRLNHFDLVQYLLESSDLQPPLKANTFVSWRNLWPASSHERYYISRSQTSPLDMAVSSNNIKMFNYLLKKSDLNLQFKKISLERFTKDIVASITHNELEKNEILMNFSHTLFEQCPEQIEKFIEHYEQYLQYYDVRELIKAIQHEHKPLDIDKIVHFAHEIPSLVEKRKLEKTMFNEQIKRPKIKI